MFEVVVELGLEAGISASCGVGRLDREHQRHQCLGDKAPAIDAEMAALVGTAAKGVRNRHECLLARVKMHHTDTNGTEKCAGCPFRCPLCLGGDLQRASGCEESGDLVEILLAGVAL